MKLVKWTLLVAVMAWSGQCLAATLLAHYDVNDPASWDGAKINDLTSTYASYTPSPGNNSDATYGAPVYVASGAGPDDRAYLSFEKHGILQASGAGALSSYGLNDFSTPPAVQGYTMEGYFYIPSTANGFSVKVNTGLGFSHGTGGENQVIWLQGGTTPNLHTNTQVDNCSGGPQCTENLDINLNGLAPLDTWFHFVKVHDAVLDEVRVYIDGSQVASGPLDPDSSAVEYHWNGGDYGGTGTFGREIQGVGYSMTRFYRGALTDAEILNNFAEVTGNYPPVAVCQDIEVALEAPGSVTLNAADLDDGSYDPDLGPVTFSADPPTLTCADGASVQVALVVTDEKDTSASCVATVTVVDNCDFCDQPQPILYYDVNDPASWSGSDLQSLTALGNTLVPSAGNNLNGTYGAPVYVASGAGPNNRAYLDFQQFGMLSSSGIGGNYLNQPSGPKVGGYTLEGYFYISSADKNCITNTGLGSSHGTSYENQMVYLRGGTGGDRRSQTTVDNSLGGPHTPETLDPNLTSVIPTDQWFHFVKVHDPVADVVNVYINGALQYTDSLDPDSSALEYHDRGESYGNVANFGRELKGVRYSMTRVYRQGLTAAQVQANYEQIAVPPGPCVTCSDALDLLCDDLSSAPPTSVPEVVQAIEDLINQQTICDDAPGGGCTANCIYYILAQLGL